MYKVIWGLILGLNCFYSSGKQISPKMQRLLQDQNISSKAIVFNADFKECSSCNATFYNYIQNFYPFYKESFYCITNTVNDKERIKVLFEQQNIFLSDERLITNETLFNYFNKEQEYLFGLNNGDYFYLDYNRDFRKELSFLNTINQVSIQEKETISIAADFLKTNSIKTYLSGEQFYILNTDLNEFFTINKFKDVSSFKLDSLLDKDKIVEMLGLDSIDKALTKEQLNSKTFGDRFIDFMGFNVVHPDEIHFTFSVNSTHRLTREEIEKAILALNKEAGDLNQLEEAHTSRHTLFILKTDKKLSNFKYYKVNPIYDSRYSVDFYSGSVFFDSIFYLNSIRYDLTNNDINYKDSNFVLAQYKLNGDELEFLKWMEPIRPNWYNKKNVKNNFSGALFSKVSDDFFYQLVNYPYFINISKNIKFVIPENELQRINKIEKNKFLNKNEPAYRTDCLISLNQNRTGLFFSGHKSKNLYLAIFDQFGNYINTSIVLKRTEFNGKYYNYNNNLYRASIKNKETKELLLFRYDVLTQ